MKSERRHELQQNELDHMLAESKVWLQKHGKNVLWAMAVVAVVIAGYQYMRTRSQAAISQAYDVFGTLSFTSKDEAKSSIDQLKTMTSQVSDEGFALRSLNYQAGIASYHAVDPATGAIDKDMLEEARRAYQETLERFSNTPLEVGSALSGLALIEENLFAIDYDPAHKAKSKEYLERIIGDNRLAGTPLSKAAVDRLNRLDQVFQVITFAEAPPPPPTVEQPAPETADGPAAIAPAEATNPNEGEKDEAEKAVDSAEDEPKVTQPE